MLCPIGTRLQAESGKWRSIGSIYKGSQPQEPFDSARLRNHLSLQT